MDIRTVIENGLSEIHRHQPNDEDFFTIALLRAMRFHKSLPFWFNERTWLWTMTKGTYEYKANFDPNTVLPSTSILSLPANIQTPRTIQIKVGQNWWDPMEQTTMSEIREAVFFEGNSGYPDRFAWFNESFFFYSIPQSDFPSRMDYVEDLDRPRYSYDGANWLFEQRDIPANPTTWIPLSPTYTNRWLQEGEQMISAWAKWRMYHAYYKDREAAADAWAEYILMKKELQFQKDRFEQGNMRLQSTPI